MKEKYDHSEIEKKWQGKWEKDKLFETKDNVKGKENFYTLVEFPYPSGNLHVGHWYAFAIPDIFARAKRMQGKNVLFPIGFDAFGLPAENAAIKRGLNPKKWTYENIEYMAGQLKSMGTSMDWSRKVITSDSEYYRWTQWLFLQFYKKGLAYKKKAPVNWCPKDQTVLANEQVIAGKCERCGTEVVQKELEQWFFKITDYAERLLEDLDAKISADSSALITGSNDEPVFEQIIEPGKVKPGIPFVERNTICAIVKHWSEEKFIGLRWKKVEWRTFITGGQDGRESAEAAARQEIKEETGFQNLKFVKQVGTVHSKFFHVPKQTNVKAHIDILYFELENSEKLDLSAEEKEIHDVEWIEKEEVEKFLTPASHKYAWQKFLNPVLIDAPGSKALLNWPEPIKEAQRNWIGKSEGAEFDFRLQFEGIKQRFVILHGFEGNSHTNFLPWLKRTLEKRGHEVETPELPNSNDPREDEQVEFVLKNCQFDENTVLIGHSLGAVVALKVLQKLKKPISRLISVAQAMDPRFPRAWEAKYWGNFTWDFDYELIKKLTNSKILVLSDIKEERRIPYLRELSEKLSAQLMEVDAREEHFVATEEPEILKAVTPQLTIFTTRADTLFGATAIVLSPEHLWVKLALDENHKHVLKNREEVRKYVETAAKKTEIERSDMKKEKTGVKIEEVVAINPASGETIPIFVADYVLANYGTGAVMSVPAHDERDFAFAKKYNLMIKQVIMPDDLDFRNPPRSDKKDTDRDVVHIILRDPKNKKILVEFLKGDKWVYEPKNFIIGGIEEGETEIETAIREIREETGYTNVKFVEKIPFDIQARFFANHKDVNRRIHARNLVFDLIDDEKVEITEDEFFKKESHEIHWIPYDEISSTVNLPDHVLAWKFYQAGGFAFTEDGVLTNSEEFNKMNSDDARKKIAEKFGKPTIKYKLRDWLLSRQRYWGTPIPIVYDSEGNTHPIPEEKLPWVLPEDDLDFTPKGKSPLASSREFQERTEKEFGKGWKPESDTMDTFVDSSWYFLRYCDPDNSKLFASSSKLDKWLPVDMYSGGAEHTTMHLLYSRFFHKALFDMGLVNEPEPYTKRMNRGLILGPDGQKMSKSRGNVIDPDEQVKLVGGDAVRMYLAFIGPFNEVGQYPWDLGGVVGTRRFLERVWKKSLELKVKSLEQGRQDLKAPSSQLQADLHKTIKKVTGDIEEFKFNTAISALMILLNEFEKITTHQKSQGEPLTLEAFETFLKMLAPFAPHMTEEIWHEFGHKGSIHLESWPKFDESKIVDGNVTIVLQINGKTRGTFESRIGISKKEATEIIEKTPELNKWLDNKEIKKTIFVPDKLINFVIE